MEKYGDDRCTKFVANEGDVSLMEDLIAEEEVVVTITRTGYAKRTKSDPGTAPSVAAARA